MHAYPPHPLLIESLLRPALHGTADIELIETHISWVILAGEFAYKIKKPVNLGFLDFSTLAQRQHFCQEELRLNRRLAPEIYLALCAITGTAESPQLDGSDPAIEYAVKMRRFNQADLLPRLLEQNRLLPHQVDALARQVAVFHGNIPSAGTDVHHGTPQTALNPCLENFAQIRTRLPQNADTRQLDRLHDWTEREFNTHLHDFEQRKTGGFIRECHGDMHSGNMVLIDQHIVIFDCLEFNPDLRWVDVMSEAAFVVMDFIAHSHASLAWRFLNAYLSYTGDYAGLAVLRFYLVYRAMVRAKVAAIRAEQTDDTHAWQEYEKYLHLAETLAHAGKPMLILTHGLSGSGKTTLTQNLLEQISAIRVRSDVERKRLFGLGELQKSGSGLGSGLYTREASKQTYGRLHQLARGIVQAGFSVVVDATFLQRLQRRVFQDLARELGMRYVILDFRASETTLRQRLKQRNAQEQDASEATLEVLQAQLASQEPLDDCELPFAITIDTEQSVANLAALLPLQ